MGFRSPVHIIPSSPLGGLYWLSMKALNLSVCPMVQSLSLKHLLEKYQGLPSVKKDSKFLQCPSTDIDYVSFFITRSEWSELRKSNMEDIDMESEPVLVRGPSEPRAWAFSLPAFLR